jgi:hypothetical protein
LHHSNPGIPGKILFQKGQALVPGFHHDGILIMADEIQTSPVGIGSQDDQFFQQLVYISLRFGSILPAAVISSPDSKNIMGDLSLWGIADKNHYPVPGFQELQGKEKGDGRFTGLAVGITYHQIIAGGIRNPIMLHGLLNPGGLGGLEGTGIEIGYLPPAVDEAVCFEIKPAITPAASHSARIILFSKLASPVRL